MKSTPVETRYYYLPGHEKNPTTDAKGEPVVVKHVGQKTVGGFVFTDGACQARLPEIKSKRQAAYLFRFFGVASELVSRVDVPSRARTYSPKSEAEGVLGLVAESAPAPEGQSESPNGSGPAGANGGVAASLEAIRNNHRERRQAAGSSVATPTTLDPAKRAALLSDKGDADGLT